MVKALWGWPRGAGVCGAVQHRTPHQDSHPLAAQLWTLRAHLMQGSPVNHLGPHPGLTLGRLLCFLELRSPLCKIGEDLLSPTSSACSV